MKTSIQTLSAAAAIMTVAAGVALAQQLTVEINKVTDAGVGEKIGTVAITEHRNGTAFKVAVSNIPAGKHGFHVHEKGDCAAAMKDGMMEPGGAAGARYDPEAKKSHRGPQGAGHKGDLPALTANATGVNETVTAPKLKLSDVQGRALVIHEGGDNYRKTAAARDASPAVSCPSVELSQRAKVGRNSAWRAAELDSFAGAARAHGIIGRRT